MALEPYKINVPNSTIESLRQRLAVTDLPDELDDAGWDLGSPLGDIRRLVSFWKNEFDWHKIESELNTLPHFRSSIQCDGFDPLEIHFVHQRSLISGAIPLLFCHGCEAPCQIAQLTDLAHHTPGPGSFLEVEKLLPLLADGDGRTSVTFHVVAPSLPGFGFSEGPKRRGFGLKQYAETCHRLMLKLGYEQYVTQGGDWGFHITRLMGLLYPQHCKASHLNAVEAHAPTLSQHPGLWLRHLVSTYNLSERIGLERTSSIAKDGMGYEVEQRTKPQTLGYALADSPVSLLAWIYEKLRDWTDDYPWTDEEVLKWVSIYWFSTAGVAANLRIYYEAWHCKDVEGHQDRALKYIPFVKYGIAQFPKDMSVLPDLWLKTLGNVVLLSHNPRGGHFAAHEQPEAIVRDLKAMLEKEGRAYGCVKGLDGYDKPV